MELVWWGINRIVLWVGVVWKGVVAQLAGSDGRATGQTGGTPLWYERRTGSSLDGSDLFIWTTWNLMWIILQTQ